MIDWRASVHGAEKELLLIALLGWGPETLLQASLRPLTDARSPAGGAGPAQRPGRMWPGGMMPPETPCPGTCEVTFSGHADGMEVKDIKKGRLA